MDIRTLLVGVALGAFCASGSARGLDGNSESKKGLGDQLIQFDADGDGRISEAELTAALVSKDEMRMDRLKEKSEQGSSAAKSQLARMAKGREGDLLGTPESAAAFIVANFDSDDDMLLDADESRAAMETIGKWRHNERLARREARS